MCFCFNLYQNNRMMSMAKEELIRLIDSFINEAGLWYEFKAWIENQGYSMEELGFPDNEE
nr:MAG TPA: hypothetical protein [Caudoviricetes sp.]